MAVPEHVPVLLEPAVDALEVRTDGTYMDGTYGRGGHARRILQFLGEGGRLVVVDADPEAVAHARDRFSGDARVTVCHANFAALGETARDLGIHGRVDGLLLDLGVSSPQLDSPQRGFSFRDDGPLDMRMDPASGESAADWLNRAEAAEIARVIRDYGEERFAKRIAARIVRERETNPIVTTRQLADLVRAAVPGPPGERHPATRTFQAIRIHVNRELESLDAALEAGIDVLAPGGRFVVISFHSLEDRRVKQAFRGASQAPPASRRLPPAETFRPRLELIGRDVAPDENECRANPRARSARMRVARRIAAGEARS